MYRLSILNGVLTRQKRALLRWWAWQFNRSEEDRLNTMKNNLVKAHQAARHLSVQIKQETERIKGLKDQLHKWQDAGGKAGGPAWRDRWSARREPVVLQENTQVALKKKERTIVQQPVELARLVVGQTKYGKGGT
jgi:SMC interacting uncharacterized protein involved in chromosome segregation